MNAARILAARTVAPRVAARMAPRAALSSAPQSSIERYVDKFLGLFAGPYQRSVTTRLNKYGIKYDDVLNENDEDVAAALQRIDGDTLELRTRRLRRAMDVSYKKKDLPEDLKATFEPLTPYLADTVEEVAARREERAVLNA